MHPYAIYRGRRTFTVVTSVFVHVDEKHLAINGILLCMTLPEVEYMLVDDFGAPAGRLLMLVFVLFSAAFTGLLSAVQYRMDLRYRSAGSSALIMALVLFFLMYFPIEPLDVGASWLPQWPPVWLALGMIALMFVFVMFRIPAGAIHLYGAIAGMLFAFFMRPEAATEATKVLCPQRLEKGDDKTSRYNHSGKYTVDCPVKKGTFTPFASLYIVRLVKVQAVHPLGNHQHRLMDGIDIHVYEI